MDIDAALAQVNSLNCQYAFYYKRYGQPAVFQANCERFPSASLIKVPILLAWAYLERGGALSRSEMCDLDSIPQVEGAGFSWCFQTRHLSFHEILLMMMAVSDNHCTNLVIEKVGLSKLNSIFNGVLGLPGTELQRRMMDFEARSQGRDNWLTAQDCIHLYEIVRQLTPSERSWIEPMLLANQDTSLLMRDLPRDEIKFYHKTGTLPHLQHDWGFTGECHLFLLTNEVTGEHAVNQVFGRTGQVLLR